MLTRDKDQQAVKTYISLTNKTTVLQISEQAQHFAGMSKINIKEEIAYNFKPTFRKSGNVNQAYNFKIQNVQTTGKTALGISLVLQRVRNVSHAVR